MAHNVLLTGRGALTFGGGEINGESWRNRTWVTMLALSLALHAAAGLLIPSLSARGPKAPEPEKVVFVDLAAQAPASAKLPGEAEKPGGPEPAVSEPEMVPLVDVPPPPSGYIATIRIAPAPPVPPSPAPRRASAPPPVAAPPPAAPQKPVPRPVTVTQGVPEGPVRATFSTSDSPGAAHDAGQGAPPGGPDSGAADNSARSGSDTGAGFPASAGDRAGSEAGAPGVTAGRSNRIFKENEVDVIPRPTFRPDPPISRRAKRLGMEEGDAKALLRVAPDGKVVSVSLISENPEGITDEAFLNVLRSWLFTPGRKAGKPVTVELIQAVRFVGAAQ